jgi:hypothetical protein
MQTITWDQPDPCEGSILYGFEVCSTEIDIQSGHALKEFIIAQRPVISVSSL